MRLLAALVLAFGLAVAPGAAQTPPQGAPEASLPEKADALLTRFIALIGGLNLRVSREVVAAVAADLGTYLNERDLPRIALVAFNSAIRVSGATDSPTMRVSIVQATIGKGLALDKLNRVDEALAAYDAAIARIDAIRDPTLNEPLAWAFLNKMTLLALGRGDFAGALAVGDEFLRRFGSSPAPEMGQYVMEVLIDRGIALSGLKRPEEAIASIDDAVGRFGSGMSRDRQERIVAGLLVKANILSEAKHLEAAVATLDDILARIGASSDPAPRKHLFDTLAKKGDALHDLGRFPEAIALYDDIAARVKSSPDFGSPKDVATATGKKGYSLLLMAKRDWKSQGQATLARSLAASEAALALNPNDAIVLGNQAYVLFLLGRREEAEPILRRALESGGERIRLRELDDADTHPVEPPDTEFKALVNRVWGDVRKEFGL